jgi:hypothetical protein
MDNKCYRCNKTQCSQNYKAKTTSGVKDKVQTILKLKTSNAKGKKIECCVKCISPPSREPLHNAEVFSRPENMLINYIVDKLDSLLETEKSYNSVEDTDEAEKYDLLIKYKKRYLLVEIDEKEHFKEVQFFEDRSREKRFWENYGETHGVLRIRAGENPSKKVSQYACISRKGGMGGGCSVTNKNLFEENMNRIVKHIYKSLTSVKFIKHGYIELFNNIEIQDFKNTFQYEKSVSKKPSSYKFKEYPNGLGIGIEKLTSKEENNPLSKRIDCLKKSCKEKTTSKTGFCSKHRK